jgi:hypothetical protein
MNVFVLRKHELVILWRKLTMICMANVRGYRS